ncbi:MAG TPA: nitrilase-related carbon-nitrogen hydrolase [Solirubrobacteraceae bacterium]
MNVSDYSRVMQAPLLVAVAQPRCAAKDMHSNARAHAELIRRVRARVVIFPELSLTGYELDADPIALDDCVLDIVVRACEETQSVALVGAPIRGSGSGAYIGLLHVSATGVTVAYRKCFLGGEEPAHLCGLDIRTHRRKEPDCCLGGGNVLRSELQAEKFGTLDLPVLSRAVGLIGGVCV